MSEKRSSQRFPTANSPFEGGKSSKFSDTKNTGAVEQPEKEGRDLAKFGKDDGCRLVKKGKS